MINMGLLTFNTLDEMWHHALLNVFTNGYAIGSRDGECSELIGYQGVLLDPNNNFIMNPHRGLDPVYAAAELLWYLSGERDIKRVVAYAPQYARFANDGMAHGAYGWRWSNDNAYHDAAAMIGVSPTSQLDTAARLLKDKRATRQAVVTMWNAGDLVCATHSPKNDLPCTLSMQFILREGKLHMIVTMRSNDLWLGLPYDVWSFTCIQRIVADAVGVALGTYTHQVGSLHLYKRNAEKAKDVVGSMLPKLRASHGWTSTGTYKLTDALAAEAAVRETRVDGMDLIDRITGFTDRTMMDDIVNLCVIKHAAIDIDRVCSPLLREAWRRKHARP